MINRLLIRIKTLQILYNYHRVKGMSINGAIGTLRKALDHSYHLYLYLCGLPLDVAQIAEQKLMREEEKFLRDEKLIEDLQLLINNPIVNIIKKDSAYIDARARISAPFETREIKDYLQNLTTKAIAFTKEHEHPAKVETLSSTRQLWRNFYGEEVLHSLFFVELIEETSTYLNDDIPIVFTFVTKAFNAISENKSYLEILKPPYSSEEDEDFGPTLLELAIQHEHEYRDLISKYFNNWDKERVSDIDYIILQLAVTEAIHFPTIATKVTINEYLNLAHHYSSQNSHTFINGILHELFSALKAEGKILGE